MTWLRCKHCNHSFTDGYFGPEGFEEISKKSYDHQVFSPEHYAKWRPVSARIVSTLSKLRNDYSGRWLDIGFGNGSLLLTAKEFGYKCHGHRYADLEH